MAWNSTVVANAANTTSVAGSQTPAGAGAVTLTGSPVTFGSGAAQKITIISTGDISNRTFTLVGTDIYGNAITETRTGPNNATVTSTLYYASLSSATISGAAAAAITMGNAADSEGKMFVTDSNINPFSVGFGCIITAGSPTFTVQHTFDNVLAATYTDTTTNTWFNHSSVAAKTANSDGNYDFPVKAVKLILTAAGTVRIQLLQSGTQGST